MYAKVLAGLRLDGVSAIGERESERERNVVHYQKVKRTIRSGNPLAFLYILNTKCVRIEIDLCTKKVYKLMDSR